MTLAIQATRRYVYNLHEEIRSVTRAGEYPYSSDVPQAWIVEHLRSYHHLEVDELRGLTHRSDINEVDERIGERFATALCRSLYSLFRPMADHALNAAFTHIRFNHDHLYVTVYE